MLLSLISSTSKILDIVLFWECVTYLTCVTGFLGVMFATADYKGNLVENDDNCFSQALDGETSIEGILWFRFFATFTFGFVAMLFVLPYFLCKQWLDGTCELFHVIYWTVFLSGPIIAMTKLIVIFSRLISIPFYYSQIAKLKNTDKQYIPGIIQVYWMAQIGLPETLLSGPLLLVITFCELFIIPLSARDITLRIVKIALGIISLVVGFNDAKLVWSEKLWFWKRTSPDWNLDEGKCAKGILGTFAVLLLIALIVYVIFLVRTSQ